MRAVFVDCTPELQRVMDSRRLRVPDTVRVHLANPDADELVAMCRDAEVMFVEHTLVPPTVLEACPSIRAIVFMGTGAGTYIDLDDAARRGVAVRTTPGYGDRAVAEHALALLFAAARGIVSNDRGIRERLWRPTGGFQLAGQRVAVIGMGGIGTCFADMAAALGMNVAGWNRTPRQHPAFVADLDEALVGANVVSLHLGLNPQTRGIIDARRLALPSPGFILVNTARAELVEEAPLLSGLASGQVGHAALDVFPTEPLPSQNPYIALTNVTLTPHVAYMTDAAYEELWIRTLQAYEAVASDPTCRAPSAPR
jgi:D-3-phosphoglycerate dehydrogenase / 2-oxoglutarate reductase